MKYFGKKGKEGSEQGRKQRKGKAAPHNIESVSRRGRERKYGGRDRKGIAKGLWRN